MSTVTREMLMKWMNKAGFDASVCSDCEGVHLEHWEAKDAVLEARCFVDSLRVSYLTEIAIRPSAVLPLQGAIHFMNFDQALVKVMLTLSDHDVPRLLLAHAIPVTHLSEALFTDWTGQLLSEMDAVYKQLTEMEVLLPDSDDMLDDYDPQLH
ncbi:MAG: hypothetical protein P8X89_22780 [Reinekea sp.]|jgi:hypothetical protein